MTRKKIIDYRYYEQRQGKVNISRKVMIYDNGDMLKADTEKFIGLTKSHLNKKQLENLLNFLEENEFFEMNDYYGHGILTSDGIQQSITYDHNDKYKNVEVDYGAIAFLPRGFGEILKLLQKL